MDTAARPADLSGGREPVLTISGLTLETTAGPLVRDLHLTLHRGRHAGLVGRNGGGKSTLLAVIEARRSRRRPPDWVRVTGRVEHARGGSVALLPQNPARPDVDAPVGAWLRRCAGERGELAPRLELLAERMSAPDAGDADHAAYAATVERLDSLEAWDLDVERDQLLAGLGLGPEILIRSLTAVSGGEATRVAIAGVLLARPDLLLLDEPTNNLDGPAADFLAERIAASPAAVLLVSHDRDLLDAVAREIVEIDEHTALSHHYGGNWSFAVARRKEAREAALRVHEEEVRRRDRLLGDAARLSDRGRQFQSASQNDYYRARGKKVARRATVQLARVERQLGDLREPPAPRLPRFEVAPATPRRGRLLSATALDAGHAGGPALVQGLDLELDGGGRLAVVGANGSGKTTLLQTLLGRLDPLGGRVDREPATTVRVLEQRLQPVPPGLTVVEHARRLAPFSEADARALLGAVLLEDPGVRPLDRLSAGERRRVDLAVHLAAGCDLLILDEPTNHLDLPTVEMLEEALETWRGGLLLVTHDRRLLARARLDAVLHLRGDGGWEVGDRPRPGAD